MMYDSEQSNVDCEGNQSDESREEGSQRGDESDGDMRGERHEESDERYDTCDRVNGQTASPRASDNNASRPV